MTAHLDLPITWDQAIVNEYTPGVGIGQHSDSCAFGPYVATVSLLSDTTMRFRPTYGSPHVTLVPLPRRSAIVMTGPSRAPWTHEIVGSDVRSRRISVTFRTVA